MERWQLKEQSKKMLRGRWGQFAFYTLIFLFLNAVLNAWSAAQPVVNISLNDTSTWVTGLYGSLPIWKWPIYVACRVVCTFLIYGYIQIFMKTRVGQPTGIGDLFKPFTAMSQRVMGAALIELAIELIYRLLLCASALCWFLAIPLCVALSVFYFILKLRLSMVPIILSENPYTTVQDAFLQSYNVMRGFTWRYFVLQLSFLGWMLLSIPTFGIAVFWVIPYMTMTTVNFYYDVKAKQLGAQ